MKPSQPLNLQAIPVGPKSIMLVWNAPATSGAPITSYRISYGVNGNYNNNITVSSASSYNQTANNYYHLITGLNQSYYTFRIFAINSIGEGPFGYVGSGVWINPIPPASNVVATRQLDNSIDVSWVAPPINYNGLILMGYKLAVSKNNGPWRSAEYLARRMDRPWQPRPAPQPTGYGNGIFVPDGYYNGIPKEKVLFCSPNINYKFRVTALYAIVQSDRSIKYYSDYYPEYPIEPITAERDYVRSDKAESNLVPAAYTPSVPTNVRAVVRTTPGSIRINWATVPQPPGYPITDYNIQIGWATDNTGKSSPTYSNVIKSPSTDNFHIMSVDRGYFYYVRVRAINAFLFSDFSTPTIIYVP